MAGINIGWGAQFYCDCPVNIKLSNYWMVLECLTEVA